MTGIRSRITAALAVLGAAGLCVALGVSMSSADEPKAPAPHPAPRSLPNGTFNADLQKAQEQMFRAMEALGKNPNDSEARKQMDEARDALMKALGGFDRFPGANVPGA